MRAFLVTFVLICAQSIVAATVVVHMQDPAKFSPNKITIAVGDTVQWVNDSSMTGHQITTNPELAANKVHASSPKGVAPFDSSNIDGGASFSHKFTVPGTYHYVCPPHEASGMFGIVVVKKTR